MRRARTGSGFTTAARRYAEGTIYQASQAGSGGTQARERAHQEAADEDDERAAADGARILAVEEGREDDGEADDTQIETAGREAVRVECADLRGRQGIVVLRAGCRTRSVTLLSKREHGRTVDAQDEGDQEPDAHETEETDDEARLLNAGIVGAGVEVLLENADEGFADNVEARDDEDELGDEQASAVCGEMSPAEGETGDDAQVPLA